MISIPALREEGDFCSGSMNKKPLAFLSPPSARRATADNTKTIVSCGISIPALREEGDM